VVGKKKRMMELISKYIISVYEDYIIKCTETCRIIGEQGNRQRVRNRGGLI
jgi:hypothetical protein